MASLVMTGTNAVLGRKRCPNFNHDRDTIYDLFERYEQEKKRHSLFDLIDFVDTFIDDYSNSGTQDCQLRQ